MSLKDEDELALAVEQASSPPRSPPIEADARSVQLLVAEWGSPFCDGWESFRPAGAAHRTTP